MLVSKITLNKAGIWQVYASNISGAIGITSRDVATRLVRRRKYGVSKLDKGNSR